MKSEAAYIRKNWMLLLIILLGLILRLIDISKPFSGLYNWNEGHYSVTALNYFKYGLLLPMNEYGLDLTTSPLFTWLVHISFRIFGVHEWAARLPSLSFGVASLTLVYLIAKRLYDKNVALIASFIAAVSPGAVYFSRNVQLESMFTAFSLTALLFLIYYKDTMKTRWFVVSGICLSIAVLTKYTAILIYPTLLWVWFKRGTHKWKKVENIKLLIYMILPLVPSVLWAYLAMSMRPELTTWYVSKPEAPWMLSGALAASLKGLTSFIPDHFGYVFYYTLILTLPFLLTQWRRHAVMLIFTVSWLPLIFFFPVFYLNNNYYHYPMLYGMAILLGYSISAIGERIAAALNLNLKKIGVLMITLILALSLYQYNALFHSNYTNFSEANESEPFFSAKHVAEVNTAHELVGVDFPQTMFYAGADPAYVKLTYKNDRVLQAINQGNYSYFVLYYLGNITIKKALEDHNYTQIAPRAWHKPGLAGQNIR